MTETQFLALSEQIAHLAGVLAGILVVLMLSVTWKG